MLDRPTLGWLQIIGAVISGWMSWQVQDWAVFILAVLFLLAGINKTSKKK